MLVAVTQHIVVTANQDYAPVISALVLAIITLIGAAAAWLKADTAKRSSDNAAGQVAHNTGRIDTMQNGTLANIQSRLNTLEAGRVPVTPPEPPKVL